METNPYEYKALDESDKPLDDVFTTVLEATNISNSFRLTEEEKANYLAKLQTERDIILNAFGQKSNEGKVMSILKRLQRAAGDFASQNSEINGFVALGFDLFEKLQPQIETAMKQGRVARTDVLDIYKRLVEWGNEYDPYLGIEGLTGHLELIEEGLMSQKDCLRYIDYLKPVLRWGEADQRSKALAVLLQTAYTKMDDYQFPILIAELYGNSDYRYEVEAEEAVSKFLERHKLPFTEIYSAWKEGSSRVRRAYPRPDPRTTDFKKVILVNLKKIQEVETENPGTCRFLYDEFNIADFGRYPTKLLLKQREEFDSLKNPYGVIIFPRADWNSAFYAKNDALEGLHGQLKGEFTLRFAECEGKVDVVRMLQKFDKLYNPSDGSGHKISLLILGGHGTENSIQFGGGGKKHELYTKDLARKVSGKAGEYLDQEPTIILTSCSTGADRGIGQELSRRFGAKVVAPKEPTGLSKLYGSRGRDGKFRFNARFSNKETKVVFKQGEPVSK